MGLTRSSCQKERRLYPILCGLPEVESGHGEELVPPAEDRRLPLCTGGCAVILDP